MAKTDEPLVSVLMPVYNAERFLREAMDSILNQTFSDFEFLIINDGSTDQSESIIQSYSDQRIRYVKNGANLKLIATLNVGLELCKGKYIARMDADDIAFPERLEKQVRFMEGNPQCGLCGTDIQLDESKLKSFVRIGDSDYIAFCLLFLNPICHPTVMMRTALLHEHRLDYPSAYVHVEEYKLWLGIMNHAKVFNLNEKLLFYRVHDEQISSVYKDDQFKMGQQIRLEIFKDMVLFSSKGTRKIHLEICGMLRRGLLEQSFEKLDLKFNYDSSLYHLCAWIFGMRISLLFKKRHDSLYLRELIVKVRKGARMKFRTETFLGRAFGKMNG